MPNNDRELFKIGNYGLETDDLNWIVTKHSVAKKGKNIGKPTKRQIAFYPVLSDACYRLLRLGVSSDDSKSLERLIEVSELCKCEIVDAVNSLQGRI